MAQRRAHEVCGRGLAVGARDAGQPQRVTGAIERIGGELVSAGSIIVRQRGTKFLPGLNTGLGKDDTIFATITGHVKFTNQTRLKKKISVLPAESK